MKRNTLAKFTMVKNRIRDMKARFKVQLNKPEGSDGRMVSRVAAGVFSEGDWLCKLCRRMMAKYKDIKPAKEDLEALEAAEAYFKEQFTDFEDEISRNLFIPSLDAEFITHCEAAALLAQKIDAQVQVKVATTLGNYELDDEEIPAKVKARRQSREPEEEETADV